MPRAPRRPPDRAERTLPMAGPWGAQRQAAAGNERKLLQAARELLRHRDAGDVDVREIAAAAGVGVGTVYRRFGGKAELLAAVVGEPERALQDAVVGGPPPLGPGAPPAERLVAFLEALVRLTEENLQVLLATDATPAGRRGIGAYAAWRTHVAHLVAALRPELDEAAVRWYADLLLAPLEPALYAEHRRVAGLTADDVAANLGRLVDDVARGASGRRPPAR